MSGRKAGAPQGQPRVSAGRKRSVVAEGSPWEWGCGSCMQVPWDSPFPSLGVLLLPPGRDHPGGVGGCPPCPACLGLGGRGGEGVSMPPAGSPPLQGTGISQKPLQSASPYSLHFSNPSLGPRATFPPAPHGPCSRAWAESCPLPSLAARGMIGGTGTSAGGPAVPAAPGAAGGWHLPPTCPGAGSSPRSLSGQL